MPREIEDVNNFVQKVCGKDCRVLVSEEEPEYGNDSVKDDEIVTNPFLLLNADSVTAMRLKLHDIAIFTSDEYEEYLREQTFDALIPVITLITRTYIATGAIKLLLIATFMISMQFYIALCNYTYNRFSNDTVFVSTWDDASPDNYSIQISKLHPKMMVFYTLIYINNVRSTVYKANSFDMFDLMYRTDKGGANCILSTLLEAHLHQEAGIPDSEIMVKLQRRVDEVHFTPTSRGTRFETTSHWATTIRGQARRHHPRLVDACSSSEISIDLPNRLEIARGFLYRHIAGKKRTVRSNGAIFSPLIRLYIMLNLSKLLSSIKIAALEDPEQVIIEKHADDMREIKSAEPSINVEYRHAEDVVKYLERETGIDFGPNYVFNPFR